MKNYQGIPGSEGIAVGKALVYLNDPFTLPSEKINSNEVPKELQRFMAAVEDVRTILKENTDRITKEIGAEEAEIFEAHLSVLDDPEVVDNAAALIKEQLLPAPTAMWQTAQDIANEFAQIGDDYLSARSADILDVSELVVRELTGEKRVSLARLNEPCILVGKDITPSETASMDKKNVLAMVCEMGSRTSHAVILSRSLGIPAVVGVTGLCEAVRNGMVMIVDGAEGKIVLEPDEETLAIAQKSQTEDTAQKQLLKNAAKKPAITLDGSRVMVEGNIGYPADTDMVLENGGDGIGLFRSEFFYMDSNDFPTEELQYQGYRQAVEKMGDKQVIVRTMDIGGDKKLPYFEMEPELNPFLGYRALRICLDRSDVFKPQLRALLRASAHGNLAIMLPMVSCIEEIEASKRLLEECKEELRQEGKPFREDIPLGIMIEIPSIALQARDAAKLVNFFSIGTNDLLQYSLAADRMNQKVARLYNPFHPGVLRLIAQVIYDAHAEGIPVGMCGEMAGDVLSVPLLLGLGLDHFSMSATAIPKIKNLICGLKSEECRQLATQVLAQPTGKQAEGVVKAWLSTRGHI
ncbi:phosphoenolpyruvate--protein phosphotransferase [Oscillospiraceae bacterium LTW-04]|nr:phosphoenolpyruvate--protein phosphotransferase [Oscillospiraceae bacterium MB24-C1]